MRRTYWSFYWPLAVSGTTVILTNQFHNGALARFPDGSREIASFAYAYGLFSLSRAALVFVPQMTNLLARSTRAHRVTLSFLAGVGAILTLPLLVMGHTAAGAAVVDAVFELDPGGLAVVRRYLRWLAPLVVVDALRQHTMGLLIQRQSTRIVTVLNGVRLASILGVLIVGFQAGLSPVATLVSAEWAGSLLHLLLQLWALVRIYRLPEPEHEELRYREALAFFWPVAVTSVMFAVSRPVLYAFVSRGSEAELSVAALRVAFDFALFFHQPLNQFRNLYATFGTGDLRGLRAFQTQVVLAMAGAMVLVSITPLDALVFGRFLGVEGEVQRSAEDAFRMMALLPLVVGFRNYFHGIALARLSTRAMAYGGIIRVAVVTAAAWIVAARYDLGHVGASLILVVGFAVEALVVLVLVHPAFAKAEAKAKAKANGPGAEASAEEPDAG